MQPENCYFRLISQRLTFRAVRIFNNAAGIACVHGVTLDGRRETTARLADVTFLDEFAALRR